MTVFGRSQGVTVSKYVCTVVFYDSVTYWLYDCLFLFQGSHRFRCPLSTYSVLAAKLARSRWQVWVCSHLSYLQFGGQCKYDIPDIFWHFDSLLPSYSDVQACSDIHSWWFELQSMFWMPGEIMAICPPPLIQDFICVRAPCPRCYALWLIGREEISPNCLLPLPQLSQSPWTKCK